MRATPLRFAVLANPGIGGVFLHTLKAYGLTPQVVVTSHPGSSGRRGVLRRAVRGLLSRHADLVPPKLIPGGYETFHLCRQYDWPVLATSRLREPASISRLHALDLDYFFVFSFELLEPEVFSIPAFGTLSLHPSLLPARRGPAPVFWTTLDGDERTGFSIIQVDEGIDTGRLVLQESVAVDPAEDGELLLWRLCRLGARRFARLILELENGQPLETTEQPAGGSFQKRPKTLHTRLDLAEPSTAIIRTVRASRVRGGATLSHEGCEYTVLDALEISAAGRPEKDGTLEKTMRGHLCLRTIDGKRLLMVC